METAPKLTRTILGMFVQFFQVEFPVVLKAAWQRHVVGTKNMPQAHSKNFVNRRMAVGGFYSTERSAEAVEIEIAQAC